MREAKNSINIYSRVRALEKTRVDGGIIIVNPKNKNESVVIEFVGDYFKVTKISGTDKLQIRTPIFNVNTNRKAE